MKSAGHSRGVAELTMREALNCALVEALEGEDPVVLLGQDIGPYGGTFGVTRGLWERFGEDVVRDGPLCESSTVGFGIGLAMNGVRAIVELEIMDFVGLAMDQVFNQAAKLHYFTGGKLRVPLVIRAPIATGVGMGPQHSQSLEAWFMHVPGLRVVIPSNAADAYGLLRSALSEPNPVLFLENARLYGRRCEVDVGGPAIPFGKARVAREGSDVTVVATSAMVDEALRAADVLLDEQGISLEVIDPRTLAPLDVETIVSSVRKTMRAAVVHEAHRTCGVGAEIASIIMEQAFDHLDAPVARVAAKDVPTPSGALTHLMLPSQEGIMEAVTSMVTR